MRITYPSVAAVVSTSLLLFLSLAGRGQGAVSEGNIGESKQEGFLDISPDGLYERMHRMSIAQFKNGTALYVVRKFDASKGRDPTEKIQEMRELLTKSMERRIENDRRFGAEPDLVALKREVEETIAEYSFKLPKTTRTAVERYYIEGDKFRIERTPVSNELSLEEIRKQVAEGRIDLSKPATRVWDGKVHAEIIRGDPNLKARFPTSGQDFSAISYHQEGKPPEFMSFGRSASDPNLLDTLRTQKLQITVNEISDETEKALLLRAGAEHSVGLVMETIVLPAKNYVMKSATMKMSGAVLAREENSSFVQTTAGFWLPQKVRRETYRLSAQGVPELHTSTDMLAIEPPETNADFPPLTFRLVDDPAFKGLKALTHMLPNPPKTLQIPTELSGNRSSKFVLIAINILVVLIIIAAIAYRRKTSMA